MYEPKMSERRRFNSPNDAMAKRSTDIFIVCDYPIFRTALGMLIESDDRFKIVGEATIAATSSETIVKCRPGLILCNISDFGEKILNQLAEPQIAGIPVLVLTGNTEIEFYQQCLKLGIRGLVSKRSGVEVFFKAIEKVCDGEFWFDRSVMGATIQHMINEKQSLVDNPVTQKINGMTDREKQVVELICKGMKNKGVAEKLFITETTVRHHLTSVFNKLEVESRLELVIYAFKHRLVKIPKNNQLNFESNGGDSRSFHYV
jgi:DNA-binding NarL/FixJ family response regulator